MKSKIIVIVLLLSTLTLSGQEVPDDNEPLIFGIGAAAGFSTGYGLSFRYWPGKVGFQFTTAPYISKEETMVSLGGTMLFTLKEEHIIRLYLYWGNHFLVDRYSYEYSQYPPDESREFHWITGVGPGFEFTIAQRMSFNLMFGIASYSISRNGENIWMLNMTAESGLYYRF